MGRRTQQSSSRVVQIKAHCCSAAECVAASQLRRQGNTRGRSGVCYSANEESPMREIVENSETGRKTERISTILRMTANAAGLSLLLSAAGAGTARARPGGGGGGHPGGGGHQGGGGPHFSAPHYSAHAVPHFSPARAVSHFSRPSFHAHATASHFNRAGRGNIGHANVSHGNVSHANVGNAPLAPSNVHPPPPNAHLAPPAHAAAFHADPHSFAEHRRLAGDPAWRPFWNHGWHPHRHLGWIGPLFWAYAHGDFFYYALWPDDYYDADPFWAYGYGDVYSAIFSPYDYTDYVQGPSAPAKMAALTQSMAQSCSDEAAEVTGWPLDQIQAAVQPDQQQSALLDNLGNALVKASDEVKARCPTSVAFTPTARLDAMRQRLQTLVDAVNPVSPPLGKFYDSLSDEQKARFNGIGANAPGAKPEASNSQPPNAPNNAPNP